MDKEENKLSVSRNDLNKVSEEIVSKIVNENDSEKLKNLVTLFNVNQSKKNILRIDTFSKLLDKISIQMSERFDKKPGEFSNKDLLEYLSTIKTVIDKTDFQPESINMPVIQNNTQVNLNVSGLNKDSRERVADAIKSILSNMNNNSSEIIDICDDVEVIDNE